MVSKFSRATVLSVLFLFLLTPFSYAITAFDLSDELEQKSKEVAERHLYFIGKIDDAKSDSEVLSILKEMMQDIDELSEMSSNLYSTCSTESIIYNSSSFSWCFGLVRVYNTAAGEYSVNIANIAATYGYLDLAENLYRHIITTYVGDAYKSIAKKAEFGLNDLESKKQQAQPVNKEIEYIMKENDILKRENDLLKREIESLKSQLNSIKKQK